MLREKLFIYGFKYGWLRMNNSIEFSYFFSFFSREERIQWNYSCATIRISHKQFLVLNFAVVELGLYTVCPKKVDLFKYFFVIF